MDKEAIINRIDELLNLTSSAKDFGTGEELLRGTLGLLVTCYGTSSAQAKAFQDLVEKCQDRNVNVPGSALITMVASSTGTLRSLKSEIEAGLLTQLDLLITGDVLADLIKFSKVALEQDKNEGAKNVAAVLAAAAFEDTIRRMGINLACIDGTENLIDVLKALKDKGVLQKPQVGIAQSYLSFRNHALHAKWDKIERESVVSVLAFVEQLLMKHFGG